MASSDHFSFEPAPDLPGADRLSKYLSGAIRTATSLLWEVDVEGRSNIPLDGPGIITPNHLSFCDSVFVPASLPRRVWAIGKGEYMDSWKTKHLFPAMGMIPVDRSGGDAAQAALDTAAEVLDQGRLFMIYPEGTRSRSGNLHKGRTGAARLALRCNAPVIPVGHVGTLEVQPPDTFMMKPRKPVVVRFGRPMWAHEYGDPADPRTLRSFTDAIMFEIAELSGQRYVDTYAGASDDAPPTQEQTQVNPRRPSVVGSAPMDRPGGLNGAANGNGTSSTGDRNGHDASAPAAVPSRPKKRQAPNAVSTEPGAASAIGVPKGRRLPATADN